MQGYQHILPITVRTRDIDAWGHVNNSVYFTYMEMARADYMSRVILQSSITDLGSVGVILAEVQCQYKTTDILRTIGSNWYSCGRSEEFQLAGGASNRG